MMSPITITSEEVTLSNNTVGETLSLSDNLHPPASSRSQCSSLSDCENYECYGENGDIDIEIGNSTDKSNGNGSALQSPLHDIKRHTWLRNSLRRSTKSSKRQLGSHALANHLYRSSSFNSSGRSSNCDNTDDVYSDVSLEEDVLDLNNKFQLLKQEVGYLRESANNNDERFIRAKADNAALQAKVIMLEEQLRDVEMRSEERLQDEQKRAKECLARVEREKQLQLENAQIRLQSAEQDAANLKEEIARQRIRIEKLEVERTNLYDQIQDLRNELFSSKENETMLKEKEKISKKNQETQVILIEELSKELERLKHEIKTTSSITTSSNTSRFEELYKEISLLKENNSKLQESNEELQANIITARVEQGRILTTGGTNLATELEAMSHEKIQQALREQQDVNVQLRSYIDGILLNIVENYPQLLEVKQKTT